MFLAETVLDYLVTRAGYMLLGVASGVIVVMILNTIRKNKRRVDDIESRLETLEAGSVASSSASPSD
jgi:hypothetical protein